MTAWLIRTTRQTIETGPPSDVANLLGVPVNELVDGDGNAVSNVHAIWQPDLSVVQGQPTKYWIIAEFPDDTISLMGQTARDAVDAAELAASREATAAQLDRQEDILRAFMLLVLEALNDERNRTNQIVQGIANAGSFGALQTAAGNITPLPTFTAQQLRDAIKNKLGM